MQPRLFSGKADAYGWIKDPAAWLDHYEDICSMNGWMTDADRIRNISIAFTGEAETFYQLDKARFCAPTFTWPQFQSHLINRFRSTNFIDELEEKVQNPVQKEGESVRAYYERFARLLTQMGADSPNHPRAVKYWVSGLKPSIKMQVRIMNPTAFTPAFQLASDIEAAECAQQHDEARTK